MNILISGDFFIAEEFANKDTIDQSVIDLFQQADSHIINLEAPLKANEPKKSQMNSWPMLSYESVITVLPCSSDKEDALVMKLIQPLIIDVGHVKDQNAVPGKSRTAC